MAGAIRRGKLRAKVTKIAASAVPPELPITDWGVAEPGMPGAPYRVPPQANRVNKSSCDEAGEELIVPPGDLSSEAE